MSGDDNEFFNQSDADLLKSIKAAVFFAAFIKINKSSKENRF